MNTMHCENCGDEFEMHGEPRQGECTECGRDFYGLCAACADAADDPKWNWVCELHAPANDER